MYCIGNFIARRLYGRAGDLLIYCYTFILRLQSLEIVCKIYSQQMAGKEQVLMVQRCEVAALLPLWTFGLPRL